MHPAALSSRFLARLGLVGAIVGAAGTAHARTAVTVFLDGGGGRIVGGDDAAAARRSAIAGEAPGGEVTVPAWSGGAAGWRSMVACVKAGFAPFAVDVVDQRPTGEDYTLIMVGGSPSLLGYPPWVAGIAPSGDDVLRGAVGYVFSAALEQDPADTCESVLHEVGHTLGLDHVLGCGDLMSYEDCGGKRFLDQALPCGETEARTCQSGAKTQNAYQHLSNAVGLAAAPDGDVAGADQGGERGDLDAIFDGGEAVDDGAIDDETSDDETSDEDARDEGATDEGATDEDAIDELSDGGCDDATDDPAADAPIAAASDERADVPEAPPTDRAPPAIEFVGLADRLPGDGLVEVEIAVHTAAPVEEVLLLWSHGAERQAWACSDPPRADGVTCEAARDHVTFRIPAGLGARQLAALARDAAGTVVATEPRTIELVAR